MLVDMTDFQCRPTAVEGGIRMELMVGSDRAAFEVPLGKFTPQIVASGIERAMQTIIEKRQK